ncbi:MAG: hypothetical protein ABWY29_06545 [Blastococcus sp.]
MSRLFTARAALTAGIVLGTAASAVVLAAPAGASDPPAPTLSKSTVQRGESFTVSGTGCWDPEYDPYGSEGRLGWWAGVISGGFSGSTQTDEWHGGAWSITVDVGGHLGPGVFPIRAHCSLGTAEFDYPTVSVTVVGEPLPPKWWEVPQRPGGYPGGPPAAPPAAQPATPRATAPTGSPAPDPTVTPPTTPPPAPTSAPAAVAPTPAAGCTDCERLTGDEPLTAGEELTLSYAGFQPGEQVSLVMRSTPVDLGTFTADASGIVTANVTIPASAETGSHTLTLSGPATGDHVVRFRLAVQRGDVATRASDGSDLVLPLALGVAGLAFTAAVALLIYRRRAPRPGTSPGTDRPAQGQETETPISEPIA